MSGNEKKKNAYKDWYARNKEKLAQRRAERYKSDPAYREKVISASREHRRNNKGPSVPEGYSFTMSSASDALGISIWTLREWRKKDYFPEPLDFKGCRWFTEGQVAMLARLRDFFELHGTRVKKGDRQDFDDLVSLVYANWS